MNKWTNLNKVRIHNRHETMKHFIVKSMVVKILFNAGYEVYSEHPVEKGLFNSCNYFVKIADVAAYDGNNISQLKIVVEVETKLTKKHAKDLMKFHENYLLYMIELKGISMDIREMEKQIKHILGM